VKTEVWRLTGFSVSKKLKQAAEYLKEGRLVVFPTETVYGIGALGNDTKALKKIYQLKGRTSSKPFAWHLDRSKNLNRLPIAKNIFFEKVVEEFCPAPITSLVHDLHGETLGIRIPEDKHAREFLRAAGGLILATSANPSGQPSATSAELAREYFDGKVDLILDAGKTRYQGDSTVIDFTQEPFKIIRPGVYSKISDKLMNLQKLLTSRRHILLVCTGNTCRSPMGEGWLKAELKRKGLEKKIHVQSCGIFARTGAHPTFEADFVLKNEEIDISRHRSKPLTKELVNSTTHIVAMTAEHKDAILELYPGAMERIKVLGVEDPIGQDLQVYKDCYEKIKNALKDNWKWITE